MSFEFPERAGELSTYALNHSIELLSEALKDHPDEDLRKALAVVRLVAPHPRRVPWYGASMRIEGDSVKVGVVLRNAFEAVGDWIGDYGPGGKAPAHARSWFTQRYAGPWHQGRRDYYDWLRRLSDPLRMEEEDRQAQLTREQAEAEHRRIADFLRSKP